MRWTLALAVAVLLTPATTALDLPVTPVTPTTSSSFTAQAGKPIGRILTLDHASEVAITISLDASTAVGLHMAGPRTCRDPNITSKAVGGAASGTAPCGYLPAGSYPITIWLEKGWAIGKVSVNAGRIA